MADRPILFSAPMVRALLAGTKTQTRRRLPAWLRSPYLANEIDGMRYWNVSGAPGGIIKLEPDFLSLLPCRVGDRLWVKETWRAHVNFDRRRPLDLVPGGSLFYEADAERPSDRGKIRVSIHMPRWVSRLTLTVTDVRVQRLQDISEEDAIAEGCKVIRDGCYVFDGTDYDKSGLCHGSPVTAYGVLWDAINGEGSWDANPWVVAYTFTVARGNIDEARA